MGAVEKWSKACISGTMIACRNPVSRAWEWGRLVGFSRWRSEWSDDVKVVAWWVITGQERGAKLGIEK